MISLFTEHNDRCSWASLTDQILTVRIHQLKLRLLDINCSLDVDTAGEG